MCRLRSEGTDSGSGKQGQEGLSVGLANVPGSAKKIVGHRKGIFCIAFDPEGRTIASGSDDETVKLTDIDSGRLIHSLESAQRQGLEHCV